MISPSTNLLLIFLKEPIAGEVKTRLATTVGADESVEIYRAMVAVLLKQLKWVRDCHYRFCYAPSDSGESILHWILPQLEHRLEQNGDLGPLHPGLSVPSVDFRAQTDGDLGKRLQSAFDHGFQDGFKTVTAIGTDCPSLSARWIDTSHLIAKQADVTLGPTPDGGYYQITMRRFHAAPFQEINWSTESTLTDTITRCQDANLSTQLLPILSDIDHELDWLRALESPLGAKLRKARKLTSL